MGVTNTMFSVRVKGWFCWLESVILRVLSLEIVTSLRKE